MDPDPDPETIERPPQAQGTTGSRPWPTFFLVGAEKAGTTSLYHYLRQHPEIFLPEEKEPGFFSLHWDIAAEPPDVVRQVWRNADLDRFRDLEQATEAYLDLYDPASEHADRGDCTASYLWHPRAPDRIQACSPSASILVLVRDPVERAYSHYLMTWRAGTEDRPFHEALQRDLEREQEGQAPHRYLLSGRYDELIQRYIDRFGSDNVHVDFTERMGDQPHVVLEEICSFLELPTGPVAEIDTGERHNPYREPANRFAHWVRTSEAMRSLARGLLPERLREFLGNRLLLSSADKPEMSDEARRFLEDHYEDQANAVEEFAGREPPWSWA